MDSIPLFYCGPGASIIRHRRFSQKNKTALTLCSFNIKVKIFFFSFHCLASTLFSLAVLILNNWSLSKHTVLTSCLSITFSTLSFQQSQRLILGLLGHRNVKRPYLSLTRSHFVLSHHEHNLVCIRCVLKTCIYESQAGICLVNSNLDK